MHNIRDLSRSFCFTFFQPTRIKSEIKSGAAGTSLIRILPWAIGTVVLGNCVVGLICESLSIVFTWTLSFVAIAVAIMFGTILGWTHSILSAPKEDKIVSRALGILGGSLGALPAGIIVGIIDLVALDFASAGAAGFITGVITGLFFSALVSLSLYSGEALANGIVTGLFGGIVCGVLGVVLVGLAFGFVGGATFTIVFSLLYFRIVTYPFDAVLTSAVYLMSRRNPKKLVRAWRWCPIVWNEMVWFPLPFVRPLLSLLVQENRDEGLKQISFVIAQRGSQRRQARGALVDITVRRLYVDTLTELAEVAKLLVWMVDVPITLSAELGSSLPRFDRVIRYIEQYQSSVTPYLKIKAIESAISELTTLQHSLASMQGGYSNHLIRITLRWLEVLNKEHDSITKRTMMRAEIVNPFIFGNPIREASHNVFCGRKEAVRQIERSILGIHQPPTLLVHGSRRMGKTSILYQLSRLLGPDFCPAIIDCQNPAAVESRITMIWLLSRGIATGLRSRGINVEALTRPMLAFNPFTVLETWLDEVERAKPQAMRILVCLDEYEQLQATLDKGWGIDVLSMMRSIFQHRPDFVFVFVGAHSFDEVGEEWTNRFLNARQIRISFLKREEVIPLLTAPVPEFKMTYGEGTIDRIVSETNCQPFLIQAIAFELVNLLNENQRHLATLQDAEIAVARAGGSAGGYFANIWNEAGPDGQAIMRAIAKGDSPPENQNVLSWLRRHDVLTDRDSFAVPMVQRWITENQN